MASKLSNAARNAAADAITALLDAGSGPAYVEIREGSQPAGVGSTATGDLLVSIALNNPGFTAAVSGVATADVSPLPSATAIDTGTAGWFRVYDDNDVPVLDGAVGVEMTLNSASVVSGVDVRITSYIITMPAS